MNDYENIEDVVEIIERLNASDAQYDEYLTFKKTGGVVNKRLRATMASREWAINNDFRRPSFIDSFECHVCRRVHEQLERERANAKPMQFQATVDHYGCPKPLRFSDEPLGSLRRVENIGHWAADEWTSSRYQAVALLQLIKEHRTFSKEEVYKRALLFRNNDNSKRGV